ncbi:hypothetical protein DXN04_18175 [Chitinophaga silvisoli]|uniref:Uncharacterized protein n=1 Tax=Chitinophaga silvisoli TaxID=2291814 RepID=A0A3E1P124_9BACT|nr:hypothetical protein DXN04_18175 [Chitinophaga silvisoli]
MTSWGGDHCLRARGQLEGMDLPVTGERFLYILYIKMLSQATYLQKAGAYTLDYYQRSLYMMQEGCTSPL